MGTSRGHRAASRSLCPCSRPRAIREAHHCRESHPTPRAPQCAPSQMAPLALRQETQDPAASSPGTHAAHPTHSPGEFCFLRVSMLSLGAATSPPGMAVPWLPLPCPAPLDAGSSWRATTVWGSSWQPALCLHTGCSPASSPALWGLSSCHSLRELSPAMGSLDRAPGSAVAVVLDLRQGVGSLCRCGLNLGGGGGQSVAP